MSHLHKRLTGEQVRVFSQSYYQGSYQGQRGCKINCVNGLS